VNFRPLARMHLGELGLLEIGGDPGVAQRNQGHDALAGLQHLADFHALARHHAIHGREDGRVAQLQFGGFERGPRGLDNRLRGAHVGRANGHLFTVSDRCGELRVRLRHALDRGRRAMLS
jgi:hypothetical protein